MMPLAVLVVCRFVDSQTMLTVCVMVSIRQSKEFGGDGVL